jgi:tetratricopeptide (TPR) repeat protein
LKYFADSTLQFKPGERFAYSNSGYFLLGTIIEKVTGKPYEQVLQENIFTPLGMNNTGYDHSNTILKNRAAAYEKNGRSYTNANYLDMSIPYAAGSLYSTVEDLYIWDQALYTNQLLQKENMDLLFTKHISSGRSYYGYGWSIGEMPIGNTTERLQTISHSGGINGFNTLITRIPSDKSLIVLLNNTGGAPLQEMATAISGILYDKSYDFPKKSIAYSLVDVIGKSGTTTALAYYKDVKDSKEYLLDDNEMIVAGYELLKSGKAKEAAFLFKLDVEAFPKSFNAYDSYGEALLVLGDKTKAIENYKKSVKLNPGNENGIKVLKEQGVNTDDLITKVSVEHLKLLEGEYAEVDSPNGKGRKIIFKEMNGILNGNDAGYAYKLVPVGEDEFINPDDGASLVFNTKDKNAITLLLFGKIKLKKVM